MESKKTIKLHCLENRVASGYVTFGSYWEKKTIQTNSFLLQNEKKQFIPVQSRIAAWWPDGSIKWAFHTADASQMGQQVVLEATSHENSEQNSMIIRKDENDLYVDNGVLSFKIPTGKKKTDTLLENLYLNGALRVKKAVPILYLEEQSSENEETNFDLDGQTKVIRSYQAAITAVTVTWYNIVVTVVANDV